MKKLILFIVAVFSFGFVGLPVAEAQLYHAAKKLKKLKEIGQSGMVDSLIIYNAGVRIVNGVVLQSTFSVSGAVTGDLDVTGAITALKTTEQFRLSYDATNYMTVTLLDDAHTTFATVDPDGAEADINFAPDGNVGIKTAAPSTALEVTGTVTATEFVGGGVGLTGINADSVWNIITLGSDAENVSGQVNFIASDNDQGNIYISTQDNFVISGFTQTYLDGGNLSLGGSLTIYSTGLYETSTSDIKIDPDEGSVGTLTLGDTGDNDTTFVQGMLRINGEYNFFTDTSAANDAWGFENALVTAYKTGMSIYVQIAVVNTDGATLQINALGAKDVHKLHNQALITGDVEVGQILHLVYDGTEFQLLSQLAQ